MPSVEAEPAAVHDADRRTVLIENGFEVGASGAGRRRVGWTADAAYGMVPTELVPEIDRILELLRARQGVSTSR
jgi:hypothetical protein